MDARRSELLKASPRMFESDLLDKLSRVHPAVPVVIFLPEIVVLLALAIDAGSASTLGLVGLFVGGYFFWTLMEYWIHRVIFHFARTSSGSPTSARASRATTNGSSRSRR